LARLATVTSTLPEEITPAADVYSVFASLVRLFQAEAGFATRGSSIVTTSDAARVAVEHVWAPAAQMAAELASLAMSHLAGGNSVTIRMIEDAIAEYLRLCEAGPRTAMIHLHAEARHRGIPAVLRAANEIQFGHGRNRRLLANNMTERTSHAGVQLAGNKTRMLEALRAAGLPVPRHTPVADLAAARQAAMELGFPLVVKPVDRDQGAGVTAGVTSLPALDAAYHRARQASPNVAVEQFIPGETVRLLAIGGVFVAACQTQATPVVGDGRSTVQQLVEKINAAPSRGMGHTRPLTRLTFDEEALGILQGLSLTPDSVLPFGRTIRLRSTSNLSRGGESISVTDVIHPDNRRLAELAARVSGLDITGIDFRTTDIARSWKTGTGAVIEVNPSPGMRMHIRPSRGPSADIATPIFRLLYPDPARTRIPVVAVTGTNGKTTTTRLIAHILRRHGLITGMATTGEVAIDGQILSRGDSAGAAPAFHLLSVPTLEAAVLETARGGIIKYGLGFDACDVAVVTNVAGDHLGELGIDSLEALARVKFTVPRVARAVVLNAESAPCLAMKDMLHGKEVMLFSLAAKHPAITAHVAAGGTAYVLADEDGQETICRLTQEGPEPLLAVAEAALTLNGAARHNIANLMAGLAAVDLLKLPRARSLAAARDFGADPADNAGRLTPVHGFPCEVVVDFAHNKHGFAAIADVLERRGPAGRKTCVVTLNAGRLSDDTVRDAVEALAPAFDRFFTYNGGPLHKRRPELAAVLAQGLIAAGVPEPQVTAEPDQFLAIRQAIAASEPGDLVMILHGFAQEELFAALKTMAEAPRE
jgi:cyanophycin synthetase